MTPKMKSPFDVKPDEIYVFDNEDKDDITEAPEHLEVSSDADLLMAIYKLRKPGAILHSVNCQAMIASHLFRGNEYKLRYHAMIQVRYAFKFISYSTTLFWRVPAWFGFILDKTRLKMLKAAPMPCNANAK